MMNKILHDHAVNLVQLIKLLICGDGWPKLPSLGSFWLAGHSDGLKSVIFIIGPAELTILTVADDEVVPDIPLVVQVGILCESNIPEVATPGKGLDRRRNVCRLRVVLVRSGNTGAFALRGFVWNVWFSIRGKAYLNLKLASTTSKVAEIAPQLLPNISNSTM